MRRLTIYTTDDQSPITPPDATGVAGATETPSDKDGALADSNAPRILELSVTAVRTPVAKVSPITMPEQKQLVQAAEIPRESVETSEPPLAAEAGETIPESTGPTTPPPLFLEPWIAHPSEPSLTVTAPPLGVPSVETSSAEPFLEPWLTEPGEQPGAQTETPSPKKTVNRFRTDRTTQKHRKETEADRRRPSTRRMLFTALRDVFIAIALLFITLQFFAPSVVREHSMENTLEPNEILYVTKQAYWFGPPGYSDIVIFQSDIDSGDGTEKTLVKRIIGIPGDRIAIQGGTVYRNGEALDEPYTKSGTTPGSMNEVVVPADSYFVLGDNREVSRDSRSPDVGFVAREQLRGQILVRVFPLDKFTIF